MLDRDWQGWWQGEPMRRLLAVLVPVDEQALSDQALIDRTERIVATWEELLNERFRASGTMLLESWLERLVGLAAGRKRATLLTAELLAGIETRTTEVNEALWALSREARRSTEVLAAVREGRPERLEASEAGRAFLGQMQRFLKAYGHREGACWYISLPSWRRDPSQVWRMLRSLVEAEQPAEGRVEWEKVRDMVAHRLRWLPPLRHLFLYLVDRLRKMRKFREDSHFDLTLPLPALQDLAGECGRGWRSGACYLGWTMSST